MFVGGLSQSTTQESLSRHFQSFGTVDAIVMIDKATGRSRGFGFCTFETAEAAQSALSSPQIVDNKTVECCLYFAKSTNVTNHLEHKIFAGALTQATTTESLQQHFSQYGECEAIVMMDKVTGRSRGFGFCTFVEHESLLAALSKPQVIDGRTADCKVCSPKGEVLNSYEPNRIFVGGLPQTADESKLREHFSRYGTISEARVMMDKESGRSRGFGYVTFCSAQSCELALANRGANSIDEKWVEVKRCTGKALPSKDGASQALAELRTHLTQVAHLTTQLQNILGQPLMQALQFQAGPSLAQSPSGTSGKGKTKGDLGKQESRAHTSR